MLRATVEDDHKGSPNQGEVTLSERKLLSKPPHINKGQNALKAQGPPQPNNCSGPSIEGAHSHAQFPPRSRASATLEPISASLEGPAPLEQISTSLEANPRPMAPHSFHQTRALNAQIRRMHNGQKANLLPHHAADTSWGSDPVTVRPNLVTVQPSLALCRYRAALCRQAGVILWHCAANSSPPSTASPSKGHGRTLEERTGGDQAYASGGAAAQITWSTSSPPSLTLCGHLWCCGSITGAMQPSASLWRPVLTRRHHAGAYAARALLSGETLEQAQVHPRSVHRR
jgi:hypothetical protein